jgi:hypothetical protein
MDNKCWEIFYLTTVLEYELDGRLVSGFGESFADLRTICGRIMEVPNREFRAGRVVLMGLANHTHLLLIGGLRTLEDRNAIVWSSCVRGLMEVLGDCVLIREKRAFAPTLLNHVNAGRLYNTAKRLLPGLAADLQRLHGIVHPGPNAIVAGHRLIDRNDATAAFTYGLVALSEGEGREGVTVLANMAVHIIEKLHLIAMDVRLFLKARSSCSALSARRGICHGRRVVSACPRIGGYDSLWQSWPTAPLVSA